MSQNPLGEVIQAYMDDPRHRYAPRAADLARETGVSEQVISKWLLRPMLPKPAQLHAFARGTGVSYARLLTAALRGKGYIDESMGIVQSDDLGRLSAAQRRELAKAVGLHG